MTTSLRLGPLLRHVGTSTATVWVETDAPCDVGIRVSGCGVRTSRTLTVHGHHYAVCEIEDLRPGATLPYEVLLDGIRVWPEADSDDDLPPAVLRTLDEKAPTRLLYGSCRTPTEEGSAEEAERHGPDLLRATARRLAREEVEGNLVLLLIGDQVYADELREPMRAFLRRVRERDRDGAPEDEVVHYDEYAELYRQAWSDPLVRRLLATVPTLMVFDDHDVRDDWNTSAAWRRSMDALPWWRTRATSGLGAYWIYQHVGNLSPAARAEDPLWAALCEHRDRGTDAADTLDSFASRAHDDPSSYRWSHRYDVGGVRVLMLDTRCGRALGEGDPSDGSRSILGAEGHDWLDEHLTGGPEHVVVASTVPVLLPPAVQHLEAWNEAVCAGAWGRAARGPGERLRQALDLEHWGAFQYSLHRLSDAISEVARGERGPAPATVLILSGDVHFSYAARVRLRTAGEDGSRVTQLVSSALCNRLSPVMRRVAALSAGAPFHLAGAIMSRAAGVRRPSLTWRLTDRPYFDNTIGEVDFDGRGAHARWYHCPGGENGAPPRVRSVLEL